MARATIQERRVSTRGEFPSKYAINLLEPYASLRVSHVNCSEGGLCLRLQETLEVRSPVRLQLLPSGRVGRGGAAVEFRGRVAWVIQRLDLSSGPPFLYDVGIEFVDPPPKLRQLVAQAGVQLAAKASAARGRQLSAAIIRGLAYVPSITRQPTRPARWHLVVAVDGVACFSGRFPSERAAEAAWEKFRRAQARKR